MVQKGRCTNSFTAAISACGRRTRRENRRTLTCFSPWSIISCWFDLDKSKGGKKFEGLQSHDENTANEVVLGRLHGKSSSAQEVSEQVKEPSFSLGIGFALIHLMAASKIELDKMVALCKEMETLLQNFKTELQHEGKDTKNDTSYSPSKAQEVSEDAIEHVSVQDCPSSSWEKENSESDIAFSSYQNSNCKMKRRQKSVEMDRLEAELAAELEHLQLQLDTEVMFNYSNKKCSEKTAEVSTAEESQNTSFGEVFEQPEIGTMECYQGVPPRELERRLYELQEVRQQERIKELKLALECALEKLDENQRELSWWKDTARVVYRQFPIRCRSVR